MQGNDVISYERGKIRERIIRDSREKVRLGKVVSTGAIPFGFRYNKEKATLEENSERAQIIRLIYYAFANENLSLQSLADRLNRVHIPTPRGGDRWRASTLGVILRNEVYIGKIRQFRKYHVEPRLRRQTSTRNKKTSTILRPKEEWITVRVLSLIQSGLFEAVQRKLKTNADLSKRNTKRQYLLSRLLYLLTPMARLWTRAQLVMPLVRSFRRQACPISVYMT